MRFLTLHLLSFCRGHQSLRGFPDGSVVQNPSAVQQTQETQPPSLARDDPLEEEMATHFSILAWRIPWTKEPGGLPSMGSQKVGHASAHDTHMWH